MRVTRDREASAQHVRTGNRPSAGGQGFSLVELMVVISLTGVILACSFVSLQHGMPGHELRATSSKLASELRLARQKAVTQNNNYTVIFDPAIDRYIVWDDNGSDGYYSAGEEVRILHLPEGIQFGTINIGASNMVTFRPNGSADRSGYVEICGDGSTRRRVDVARATGSIIESRVGS